MSKKSLRQAAFIAMAAAFGFALFGKVGAILAVIIWVVKS